VTAGTDLRVGDRWVIPADELRWSFGPSGGPGGQHANRAHTRVEVRFDLAASAAFPDDVKRRIRERLGADVVTVTVDDTRSQWQNRTIARRRLARLLEEAARRPPVRKPTRPTRASRIRRREEKRRRAEKKRLRRPPEPE